MRAVADALDGELSFSSGIARRAEPLGTAVDVVDDAVLDDAVLVVVALASGSVVGEAPFVAALVGAAVASVARWPWPP